MRIISGKWRGVTLFFPKSKSMRPTQDRVKESIFNIVQIYLPDISVLDLCAGCGGLGIEALSRGAKQVTFVDIETQYIQKNIKKIMTLDTAPDPEAVRINKRPAVSFLKNCRTSFDLILFDPPWRDNDLYVACLDLIAKRGLLKPGATLICEHQKKYNLPETNGLSIKKQYKYGNSAVTLLESTPDIG